MKPGSMFWRGLRGYLPANIVQGLVGLGSITVFTRLMGQREYGLYALGYAAMTLAHTVAFTWLEAAMARFLAAQPTPESRAHHLATLYRTFLALAAIVTPLAVAALWLWPAPRDVKVIVTAALAAALLRALAKLGQERRRAAGEVAGAACVDIALSAGGFAVGVGFALAGFGGAAPLLGAALAAALCLPFVLPGDLRLGRGGRFEAKRLAAYAAYGLPLSLSLILTLVLGSADRFLIAGYLDARSVGAYHAAATLANRTLDVMFVWLGAAGVPALITALERGGRPALTATARQQASTMLLLTAPAAAGLAMVSKPLATLLVGGGLNEAAAQVTPLVALGAWLAGITGYYFNQAFVLARRSDLLVAAMAAPAVANIGLNLLLIPQFGLIGAAWAMAGGYAAGLVASLTLSPRAGPMPVPLAEAARVGAATLLMIAALALLPSAGGLAELLLKTGIGAVVFAIAALALDAGGARSHCARVILDLQARRAT